MRILAMVTDAFGGEGGIAQYNRDLLSALAATDQVEAIDLCSYSRTSIAASGVVPSKVKIRTSTRSRTALALAALRSVRPDMVFCGHPHLAPLAAVIASLRGAQLWQQMHGIDAWERPSRLRRWANERAHFVTVVSRYTKRRVLSWMRGAPHRVGVLPNTVGPQFTPGPRSDALARQFGLGGKRVLLTVGRLAKAEGYKGQDRVIELLPTLSKQHPELVYLVVGDGDDQPRLEALARELGVAHLVRFVGSARAEQLADIYRLADVFVMPSTGEGFGIAFLEAMACGVPAIGLNADGSSDPLHDGRLGECVAPEHLLAAIERQLDDAQSATIVSHRVSSAFGVEKFRAQVASLIDRVTATARCNE